MNRSPTLIGSLPTPRHPRYFCTPACPGAKVPRFQFGDSFFDSYCRSSFKERGGLSLLLKLAGLGRMPKVNDRQVAVRPHFSDLRALPELVVLSAPPDKRFIETTYGEICVPGNCETPACFQILDD